MLHLCSRVLAFSTTAVMLALSANATAQTFEFIDIETFPTGFQFGGREVGGLSSIDYNPVSNSWVAISDDRTNVAFFNLNVSITESDLTVGFTGVNTILDSGNVPFAANIADPEGIRFAPGGTSLYWSSEGNSNSNPPVAPFVREMGLDGSFIREFALPAKYVPVGSPTTSGIRNNNAFEPLTFSVDGATLYTGTESSLVQDGNRSTLTDPSLARILSYDAATGQPGAEYVYVVDPIPVAPVPSTGFADNGFVEFVAISDTEFLVVERAFAAGVGNSIRTFLVDISNASDVSGQDVLSTYTPVSKRLILDLADFGLTPDNIEGVAFGPNLSDGRRTLLFVSDNNFNPTQTTQFIAFAVDLNAVPVPAGLFGFAVGLLGLAAVRRRG